MDSIVENLVKELMQQKANRLMREDLSPLLLCQDEAVSLAQTGLGLAFNQWMGSLVQNNRRKLHYLYFNPMTMLWGQEHPNEH